MMGRFLRVLSVVLLVGSVAAAGCSNDTTVDTEKAKDQANRATEQITKETRDAWASLRTDGDRLADQVQTRKDPEAKQQLLAKCRDSAEQMRKNDQGNCDRVNTLYDRIRDADPNCIGAWNDIKNQLKDLNTRFGSR